MSKKNSKTKGDKPAFLTEVPANQLAILIKKQLEYRDHVNATRVQYPDPDELPLLGPDAIVKLGFDDHDLGDLLGSQLHDRGRKGRRPRRQPQGGNKGGGSGKSGGGNKGGGRGKTLPNPATVDSEVAQLIAQNGLQPVQGVMTGPVVHSEQNLEFGDQSKIKYFAKTYQRLIPLAHIWGLVEVGQTGAQELEKLTGYKAICSKENNRGQAVALLIDTARIEILKTYEIDAVATVQGVPDLRPALVAEVRDKATGETFWVAVIHLKSMRGGEQVTAAVRYQQCQILAQKLSGKGIIMGDWNCKLPNVHDVDPLYQAGYVLVDKGDTRSTQAMGGRLDAFFTIGLPRPLGKITLIPWFSLLSSGRGFTDHGLLNVR
jgi:hypothetical protein